jgi:hypothetical protein
MSLVLLFWRFVEKDGDATTKHVTLTGADNRVSGPIRKVHADWVDQRTKDRDVSIAYLSLISIDTL